jgi:hypothetical protein
LHYYLPKRELKIADESKLGLPLARRNVGIARDIRWLEVGLANIPPNGQSSCSNVVFGG